MVDKEGIEPSTPPCKGSVFPLALLALKNGPNEGSRTHPERVLNPLPLPRGLRWDKNGSTMEN